MLQFLVVRGFGFINMKRLYFLRGTAEKLSPVMINVILVKSVHISINSKFLCITRDQHCNIINITFEYPAALIN
jgi:hypothetical protein